MKATQSVKRYRIIIPSSYSSDEIVDIINAVKGNNVNTSQSARTYEVRRNQAKPFFRMFTVRSNSNGRNSGIYGKNIFRLFG